MAGGQHDGCDRGGDNRNREREGEAHLDGAALLARGRGAGQTRPNGHTSGVGGDRA
jgi:hypothetical protein